MCRHVHEAVADSCYKQYNITHTQTQLRKGENEEPNDDAMTTCRVHASMYLDCLGAIFILASWGDTVETQVRVNQKGHQQLQVSLPQPQTCTFACGPGR